MISISDIYNYFSNNYSKNTKTLKELSKDKKGNYITENIQYAYDFDIIAGDDFKSCDALFISKTKNCIYFIEFKNQSVVKVDKDKEKDFKQIAYNELDLTKCEGELVEVMK